MRHCPNWGSPYRDATPFILPGFSGLGRASFNLASTALVCREKVEKLCVSWGGSHFCKNGTRYSAFWPWCAIQVFFGKLMILDFLEIHDDCMFLVKTQWFPPSQEDFAGISLQNAIPGLKPGIPGCRFFDGEGGHQTFKNTPVWG